jgi:hypothetical protein
MFRKISAAAFALACAAVPAAAQNLTVRDLTATPSVVAVHAAQPTLDAWFDRADAVYALGEALRLFVRAGEDGYVSAFAIGPTGDATQLYPNAFHPENFVPAGATIEVPGPGARAFVTGPVGFERVEIIFTRRAEAICAPTQLSSAGPFRVVVGGAAALQRDLIVVAASEPGGAVATLETSFRSVAAPAGAAGVQTFVVEAFSFDEPEEETLIAIPARFYPLPRH